MNATEVLRPESLKAIEAMGPHATRIVEIWAGKNPKALKALEAEGQLIKRAKMAKEESVQARQRAVEAEGENPPLTDHEMMEMYGGPNLTL